MFFFCFFSHLCGFAFYELINYHSLSKIVTVRAAGQAGAEVAGAGLRAAGFRRLRGASRVRGGAAAALRPREHG